ncbi:MAG: class I SAM-dependent methyltransferase, partial [Gammaproteobacteria bacterium]|nr:class I SAM-dependent methyltransferase [Gammaproteobacteria bacterium]
MSSSAGMKTKANINRQILELIDSDMLKTQVARRVFSERGGYAFDPNIIPILDVMGRKAQSGLPFWELRCAVRWLTQRLRAKRYLEIGVRTGWSLLQAAGERPSIDIMGFELWVENYAGTANGSPSEIRQRLLSTGHKGTVNFVSGDSHSTLPAFISGLAASERTKDGIFDVIVVDGDHSATGAQQDLELCAPLVKSGGALAFDDLVHEQHPDLIAVWREFQQTHPSFLCVENLRDYPGTGLAFRLPLPSFLSKRIDATEAKTSSIKSSSIARDAIRRKAEDIGYLQNRQTQRPVDDKEKDIARLSQDLEQVKTDRTAKDDTIARLSQDLEQVKTDRT